MPIFEYICEDCGKTDELILFDNDEPPRCRFCGSASMTRLLSPHSSISGPVNNKLPGPGDTTCCGSAPGQASGCAGPGSCCGRNFG